MPIAFEKLEPLINKIKKTYEREHGDKEACMRVFEDWTREEINAVKNYLSQNSPQIYVAINENIILFEDLTQLDEKTIRFVIQKCGGDAVGLALRLGNDDLKKNFLDSANADEKDEINKVLNGEPRKKMEVDSAIRRIMAVVRPLEKAGKIKVVGGLIRGEEEVYV